MTQPPPVAPGARTGRHVVLLGLMGSGKSTVGRVLAERLGRPLLDSDVEIERATGRTVRDLATERGPDAMHDLEAAQLLRALAHPEPVVIAAAASTIERADCRDALQSGRFDVVWLRVPLPVLTERFASGTHRPDFGRPVDELLADQLVVRGPLLAAVATVVVDEHAGGPAEAAAAILLHLRDR